MMRNGLDVKEASLEFDFGGGVSTKPWPPGQKLMDYIKNVNAIHSRILFTFACEAYLYY